MHGVLSNLFTLVFHDQRLFRFYLDPTLSLKMIYLIWLLQIQTTSQSSPMQAYNLAITDLTKELDHLKAAFEVPSSFKKRICQFLLVVLEYF